MYGFYGSARTATPSASTARSRGASSRHPAFTAGPCVLKRRPSANPRSRISSFLSQPLLEPPAPAQVQARPPPARACRPYAASPMSTLMDLVLSQK